MQRYHTFVFVSALALAAGAAGCTSSTSTPPVGPTSSPAKIQHVVIMMQENRSFNNIFAGFPGATTAMQGPCKPQGSAAAWCKGDHIVQLRSINLATGTGPNQGKDIDHSHHGFLIECDANASGVCQNDGFNLIFTGESGQGIPAKNYPYAFVDRKETAPYWKLAKQYTLANAMFMTDTASSFIAHQLVLSGTVQLNGRESLTDQPPQTPWGCDAPPGTQTPVILQNGHVNQFGPFPCFTEYRTIADLLDAKDVSYQFYTMAAFQSVPHYDFSGAVWNGFDAIKKFRYGADWKSHISIPNTNFFSDIKSGKLSSVSWVIPTLADSDHPASGCSGGPRWVTKVINAIGTSQYWKNTAVILLWDDWGGFYDPVPPAQVNYTSLGFRIPMILISPYAKPSNISQTVYNYGSILRFVEETFNLGSLGTTDASANSLSDSFDFSQKPNAFTAAALPPAGICGNDSTTSPEDVRELIEHDGGVPQ